MAQSPNTPNNNTHAMHVALYHATLSPNMHSGTPSPEVLLENQRRQAQENQEMRTEFLRMKKQLADLALEKEKGKKDKNSPKRAQAPRLKETKKAPKCDLDRVNLSDVSKKLKDSCHLLMRSLMYREDGRAPLPPPPDVYYNRNIQEFIPEGSYPDNDALTKISNADIRMASDLHGKIDRDYLDFIHATMRRWGIRFFTFDWKASFEDRFNQIACQFFIKVWKWGLVLGRLGIGASSEAQRIKMDETILLAIVWRHMQYLKTNYKKLIENSDALHVAQERNSRTVTLLRKSDLRQKVIENLGLDEKFSDVFENRHCNSDDKFEVDPAAHNVRVWLSKVPYWRSEVATKFIDWLEEYARVDAQVRITGIKNRAKVGPQMVPRSRRTPAVIDHSAVVPTKLPEDWYSQAFLDTLLAGKRLELEIQPAMFEGITDNNFKRLIPKGKQRERGELEHLADSDSSADEDVHMKVESED